MTAPDRHIRPLPTTLATLAALVAIMAATSALAESPGFDRHRVWIVRTLDGPDDESRAARNLTDCLARAARDLLGAPAPLVAALACGSLTALEASGPTPRRAGRREARPECRVVLLDLALPPPRA